MSTKPKDHRPKVISFRSTLDGLNIAARESILWPCHAFNISIPQKKKNVLNVFEETVLRITEIESGVTEKIAQLICLEKELVIFIQNRLNQLDLLDDRYELSEHGKELLDEWQDKSDVNLEYVVATVFVDLLSGKLLPYVSTKQINYKKVVNLFSKENPDTKGEYDNYVNFLINPIKEKSKIKAKQIRPAEESFWNAVPDSNDIIRAIRAFNIKYKRYALLNHDVVQYPPSVPVAEAISVHDNPELVFLHCNVIIQVGNSDLLVSDGFGFGFSEKFSSYLMSQNWKWVTEIKQKAVIEMLGPDSSQSNKNAYKSYKYREISDRISRSKTSLGNIENLEVNSSNYERDYRSEIENGIKNIYESLEWAFRQVVADYPVPEWERVFAGKNFRENEKLLYGFAKKVGFSVTDKNKILLQVKPGAIKQIEYGKVELQPLIAISLAGAIGNSNHPVHRLAKNHSGFLKSALRLKKYRDPIEHGSSKGLDIDKGILKELIKIIEPMILSLVPGVADDLGISNENHLVRDVNQESLKANINLEKKLGTALTSDISLEIKEQLIRSEIMLEQFSDDKAIEIVKCYASAIQLSLYEVVKDRRLNCKSDRIREEGIEKIVQSGLYSSVANIPKEISTVTVKHINIAVQGLSSTLGAQLISVFLLGSESELTQIRNLDPEFIEFVAYLIRLRGHGNDNEKLHYLSQNDIELLKNKVFKTIKIITEIF
jgi:hypothetical protein